MLEDVVILAVLREQCLGQNTWGALHGRRGDGSRAWHQVGTKQL